MSFNQWKLLNYLKESINKLNTDFSLQNTVKEFSHLTEKFYPGVFNKNLINYIQKKYPNVTSTLSYSAKKDHRSTTYNLPTVLQKQNIKKEETGKDVLPKWKKTNDISESSISARTEQLLLAIETTNSDHLYYDRIEALIELIKQYPNARIKAVKGGAIRLLLRIREKVKNEEIQASLREALALLGYADPVKRKGIRILTMDGGGIRGLLVLEMLKKLEELTGQKVHEMFDFICGVSTGAILLYSMGVHQRSLEEISTKYEGISKEVFKQSPLWGTGSLVWSHSYYDTSLWEKKLREHLGETQLVSTARNPLCPKLCAVSAIVNQSRVNAYLFRNYSLSWRIQSQYFGGNQHQVWEAARASAAAPTYFEECKLGHLLHQDGGILVNNPTAIALHEVKLIWPNTPIQCVVSFGTGRTVPTPCDLKFPEKDDSCTTSWTDKFYKILDSATDTEAVHIMLNDLLPPHVYYRFNPYLTEMLSMVETDSKKLEQLRRDALMYLRRNEDKFQEAAKVLMADKSYLQKIMDKINLKREMLGF